MSTSTRLALALLALTPALLAAPSAAAGDHLPAVYWQVSPVYGGTGAQVTATALAWQPDPPHEIAIASLTLPAGNWLLSGKLSEWNFGDAAYGDLECALGDPADPAHADYSSIGLIGTEKVLALEVPITTTGRATTVTLSCHLYGAQPDGVTPASATIWGAKLVALQLGPVSRQ